MKSSIYISSSQIEIIGYAMSGGKVSIQKFLSFPVLEGTIINGKIVDQATMVSLLSRIKEAHPQLFSSVELVVDSSSFINKKIITPKLTGPQYLKMVKEDLGENTDNPENLVYDYTIIKTGTSQQNAIMGYAADKSVLETYYAIFREINVGISSIKIGIETIMNFVAKRSDLMVRTCVINIIDGVTLLSAIFEKGEFIVSTRTRLFGETEEQVLGNIANGLSSINQFAKSQKISDIEASYYIGIDDAHIEEIRKLNSVSNIEVLPLNIFQNAQGTQKITRNVHFSYFGILSDKGVNLANAYKLAVRPTNAKGNVTSSLSPQFVKLMAFILVIGLSAVLYLLPTMKIFSLNSQIDEMNAYLKDPVTLAEKKLVDTLTEEHAKLNSVQTQIDEYNARIDAFAYMDSEVMKAIYNSTDGTIKILTISYNEKTGTVGMSGGAPNQKESSNYVERLKSTGAVTDVNFIGYSNESAEVELPFTFTLNIKFSIK